MRGPAERAPVRWPERDWAWWATRAKGSGLLTDFDGTLSLVTEDRDRAAPLPGAREALAVLGERLGLVAVVSGRPVSYLAAHFGDLEDVRLVGLYGLEQSFRGQTSFRQGAAQWRDAVAGGAAELSRRAPAGTEVEHKGLTLAVHFRQRPEVAGWVARWAAEWGRATGLVVQEGRMSVELLPPVGADKGAVVTELAADLGAVCFLGDDSGDLPAFAALGRMRAAGKATMSVGVASAEQPPGMAAAVDVLVDGPVEAVALLSWLGGCEDAPARAAQAKAGPRPRASAGTGGC